MALRTDEQLRLGRAYAEALLPLAKQAELVGVVQEELRHAATLLVENHEFADWFTSPIIPVERKVACIEHAFRRRISDLTCDALCVITRRGRVGMLDSIARAFRERAEAEAGRRDVVVTSAVPLTDSSRAALRETLADRLGIEATLIERVDPKILGGLIVQAGEEVLDMSIRNELAESAEALTSRLETLLSRNQRPAGLNAQVGPERDA